jgi:hypothetical protein
MSIPDWLRKENINASSDSMILRLGRQWIDMKSILENSILIWYFFSFSEIIEIIDYCIKMDICYQELYPRDPNAIY